MCSPNYGKVLKIFFKKICPFGENFLQFFKSLCPVFVLATTDSEYACYFGFSSGYSGWYSFVISVIRCALSQNNAIERT